MLVDFYADWCGPCKALAPIVDELAHAKMGKLLVLKLDTDRSPGFGGVGGVGGQVLTRP